MRWRIEIRLYLITCREKNTVMPSWEFRWSGIKSWLKNQFDLTIANIKHIWQASKYLFDYRFQLLFSRITLLRNNFDVEVKNRENIGNVLLENFFLLLPTHLHTITNNFGPILLQTTQLPEISPMLEKVRYIIVKVFSLKARKENALSTLVFQ